ncbi:MAG: sulfite oxidase [Acidobacteria bacterium]|nr:sulfite oxidase [Acidobacteriota bacterium]
MYPLPRSRRKFILRVCQGMLALAGLPRRWLSAQVAATGEKPYNRGFDFSLLYDWLTPTALFFVREHLPAPSISSSSDWKLSIDGAVKQPLEISFEDLLAQESVELAATLECAGNSVGGGMIGNAQWSGTSLRSLLEKAQLLPEAQFVRLWGADRDSSQDTNYFRSIPLAKAMHADTLLATKMNGEVLPRHHGFPLRAVIPGWYSMDSVKWLRRVEVLTSEDTGWWMSNPYRRQIRASAGEPETSTPVTAVQVKAAFSQPLDGAVLIGREFTVRGAAWAGEQRVRKVELSTDGGKSWQAARLLPVEGGDARPYAWVLWEYEWSIPDPGKYELVVRAGDDKGRVQPPERSGERIDMHELNYYQKVRCLVS